MSRAAFAAFVLGSALMLPPCGVAGPDSSPVVAPTVAVLDFDFRDSSGEVQDQAAEHRARLREFRATLESELRADGAMAIARLPCAAERCNIASMPPEALVGEARAAGARLLAYGTVHKVSTLIQYLQLEVYDLGKEQVVLQRTISFRGETQQAYERAARFAAGAIKAELAED